MTTPPLADAPVEITNVPHLHDVVTTVKLLGELGAGITIDDEDCDQCRDIRDVIALVKVPA